jgi:3D (Asp-Asp-Asp) domain-containing protein
VASVVGITVWSAILAKEAGTAPPLAKIVEPGKKHVEAQPDLTPVALEPIVDPLVSARRVTGSGEAVEVYPEGTRFFDGRPIRPIATVWMTVTAYSPDARSCPGSDDNLTATLHHVTTNDFRLVAADPKILPYGSMVSIPGYDGDQVVPVLDCGSAIKGRRLDVLYPTHEIARQWGVKKLPVVVWGFADGKPAKNPRKLR